MAKINLIFPDGTEARYALDGDVFTVGRAEDNDITLGDGRVSSHHAVLKRAPSGEYVINDLGATNPVRVNGRPVSLQELKHGDTVLFGDVYVIYESDLPMAPSQVNPRRAPALNPGASDPSKKGCFALFLVMGVLVMALIGRAMAEAPAYKELPLYEGTPPGTPLSPEAEVFYAKDGDPIQRVNHVQRPDMRVYLPPADKATGAAVIICPGGAYSILAIDHEGWKVAEWFNSIGVAGIVCKYRVSNKAAGYQHPVPLLDARQAMRLTRQHAAEWNIDPKRVGIMGFSAGGHLASTVDTLFEKQLPGEDAAIFATMAHKPDFGILIYPVITMTQNFGHGGSKTNLLGKNPSPDLEQMLSTELQVTAKTPPTFLVSTYDDKGVPPLNAMAFYSAMYVANVPGELHIWESGGHGYGMLPSRGEVATEWPIRLEKWMRGRGLLTPAK
jgi:acetyl esterase/lipase